MSNPNVGIDISEFQAGVPAGPWLFVVHKATEGTTYVDPKFAERYPTLTGLRGAYHYARPGLSDGVTQANHFADTVLAAGFKPGEDMWQLDAEDGENKGVAWQPFIADFMEQAAVRLGTRGFLYAGWPFVQAHGLQQAVATYKWWLPDYNINNGAVHDPQTPSNVTPLVVVQQFTSAGNLDQNIVRNQATWNNMMAPVDLAAIAKLIQFKKAVTARALQYGDTGYLVEELNGLLTKMGFGQCEGTKYGVHTALAVWRFKSKHNIPFNPFGFGAAAVEAMLP